VFGVLVVVAVVGKLPLFLQTSMADQGALAGLIMRNIFMQANFPQPSR
jgi:hypothetical protein